MSEVSVRLWRIGWIKPKHNIIFRLNRFYPQKFNFLLGRMFIAIVKNHFNQFVSHTIWTMDPWAIKTKLCQHQHYDKWVNNYIRTFMSTTLASLTRTALSRTTCDTVSRNWAAMPGLFKPRVNLRSAIIWNLSLIKKTKKIIKNTAMPMKNIHSIVLVTLVSMHTHSIQVVYTLFGFYSFSYSTTWI